MMNGVIHCDDLDEAVNNYTKQLGYRLDMIVPADAPTAAVVSKDGETIRLECNAARQASDGAWMTGRAGMEYRDLIPDRLGGKVIASHIRLRKGGEVPDYVHYHKVDFQMIYCLRGRIKVVYEDQGPPFWLETGDCVLQPPEIRHRVLECTAGAEVIEVSMPAEHETWVEHDIDLPTARILSKRDFGGQRFVHSKTADAEWKLSDVDDFEMRETGIMAASGGIVDVHIFRSITPRESEPTAAFPDPKGILITLDNGGSLLLDILQIAPNV